MCLWERVAADIAGSLGTPFVIAGRVEAAGGCVNRAFVLTGRDGTRWFVKLNRVERLWMFQAEAAGLAEIRSAGALRVPLPLCSGSGDGESWLVLEHLPLSVRGDSAVLGRRLAALHRHGAARFGWHADNAIGATPQANTPCADWIEFWRDRRLAPQLARAAGNGIGGKTVDRGERLAAGLDGFFPGYVPRPALLHGDLWGGNAGFVDDEPVLYEDRKSTRLNSSHRYISRMPSSA
jgi:fructosamine-3-kinase